MGASIGLFRIFILICLGIALPCRDAWAMADTSMAAITHKMKMIYALNDSPAKTDSIENLYKYYLWNMNNVIPAESAKKFAETGLVLAEKYKQFASQSFFW
jgi:hypothetical protein